THVRLTLTSTVRMSLAAYCSVCHGHTGDQSQLVWLGTSEPDGLCASADRNPVPDQLLIA
ncbi:hypothetical protein ACWEO2_19620, partial [Nocardia sp. NPDC004278]